MNVPQNFILLSVIVLVILVFLVIAVNRSKPQRKLTLLAGLAFGLIVTGIAFGDDQKLGYSLLAGGILLAVIDMIMKWKK